MTFGGDRIVTWYPEEEPFQRVALKLARCHAAYELNEPQLSRPDHMLVAPLMTFNESQREHFETAPDIGICPEVGRRAMQRLVVIDEAYSGCWVFVQEERYRYMAVDAGGVTIRGVFSEYLAYEVIWDQ
jgi:hypothetical protein